VETATAPLLAIAEQVVHDRRHLHAHPELRFQEHETAAYVADRLRLHGIEVQTGVGGTGVIGRLRGGRPGKTIVLRADMDALPIIEETGLPFASTRPGMMHACGHDGHTSILLAVARQLSERRASLAGNVTFAFQPAEEGSGGAMAMIQAGVLDAPKADAVFGLHLAQWMPLGTVSARAGGVHAATSGIAIDVQGKGGHAAFPHLCVDTVLVAAQIVVALQSIVAREMRPIEPAVITIGRSHVGTAANIIADTGQMLGTIRSYREETQTWLGQRVTEVATGIARSMRAECAVRILPAAPPVMNDPDMAALARSVATEIVGAEGVVDAEPTMAGDDVAEMLKRVPGCYLWVGTRNEGTGTIWDHHHPKYDFDEAALMTGVRVLTGIAERFLAS
jgi:amidohydrolase